jgi:hypothetical protein
MRADKQRPRQAMTKTFKIIALIVLCAAIGSAPACAARPVNCLKIARSSSSSASPIAAISSVRHTHSYRPVNNRQAGSDRRAQGAMSSSASWRALAIERTQCVFGSLDRLDQISVGTIGGKTSAKVAQTLFKPLTLSAPASDGETAKMFSRSSTTMPLASASVGITTRSGAGSLTM